MDGGDTPGRGRAAVVVPRRRFLRQTAGAITLVGVMPLLAACGLATNAPASSATSGATNVTAPVSTPAGAATSAPAPAAPPTAGAGGKLTLPTYVPIELVKPDLPATDAGVDPAYFTFPKTLV